MLGVCKGVPVKAFILVLLIALISVNATAFDGADVIVPEEIDLYENARQFKVIVDNTSDFEETLNMRVLVPNSIGVQFIDWPRTIGAGERKEILISLNPPVSLTNTSYNASIEVKLGNEKVVKDTKLNFLSGKENSSTSVNKAGLVSFSFTDFESGSINLLLIALILIFLIVFMLQYTSLNKLKNDLIRQRRGGTQ